MELYDKQEYTSKVENIDSIHALYKDIELPITINIFKKYTKIKLLYILNRVESNIKNFCLQKICCVKINFQKQTI